MAVFPTNSHHYPLGDGEVSYLRADYEGSGTTVWIHGFLEHSLMWTPLWESLRLDGTHILIDLPGHGNTDSFSNTHSMDFMAECVELALRDAEITGPVRLIGHSMGGYTALAYAERYPERIQALMLYHSTAYPDSEEKKVQRDRAVKAIEEGRVMFIKEAVRNLFAADLRDQKSAEIEQATQWAIHTDPRGIAAAMRGMRDRPDRRELFTDSPNAFAVVGMLDPAVDAQREASFLEQESRVETIILPQAGHMSHLEETDAAVQALQDFLDKTAQK